MKLSEQELAQLFQSKSEHYTSQSSASDYLTASSASSDRLNHLEDLISDRSTAKALKISLGMKEWSQVMTQSIENSRQSWYSFLGMSSPLKTGFATVAFAFAFAVALPQFSQLTSQQPAHVVNPQQQAVQNDIINVIQFDENSDRLSRGGFDSTNENDQPQDGLFNASFG